MFVFTNASDALAVALQSFQELLISPWFYLSLGLIGIAALIGQVFASVLRKRLDLVSLGMGWPAPLRMFLRILVINAGVAMFALLTWIMRLVMVEVTWPSRSYTLAVATSLATAWLIICFFTAMIRNPLAVRLVSVLAWIVAALSILGLLTPAVTTLDSFAVVLGGLRITPLLILKVAVSLIVALWIARVISNFLETRITHATELTPSVQVLLVKLVRVVLLALAVLVVLGAAGIDLSVFALFSGAVGVGVGFGLQKIVGNFVSGIILLADKSVKPGDIVTIGDSFGRVSAMNTRYISVASLDGREFLIPNEDLVTQKVINWTYSDKNTLLSVKFGVSYLSEPRQVIEKAIQAALTVPRVSKTRQPTCQLTEFGEWALNFTLNFWIEDPERGLGNVRGDVMLALLEAFRRENIDLPYVVRDSRSRGETPPASAP